MKKKIMLALFLCLAVLLITVTVAATLGDERSMMNIDDSQVISVDANTGGKRLNILVGGTDRATGLTDVLMLVSLDRGSDRVSVMQIPRDTYANYTDKSYKKINGAYSALGGEGLSKFVSESFSVPVDKYIIISPDAFRAAVDAIGGVEIELSEDMNYRDPYQGLNISLSAGRHKLDGAKAEQFIRYRSGYENGDLGRMDAQKVFLTALFERISAGVSPMSLMKLSTSLLGKTDTNISISEAPEIAAELSGKRAENIVFVTAPGRGAIAEQSGASYYVLSAPAMNELLAARFGGERGDFDPKGSFLNKRYQSFRGAYLGYCSYKVYSVEKIRNDGLQNADVSIDK